MREQAACAAGGRGKDISSWGLFTGGGDPHYFISQIYTHIN
jgi:hypothetical protein